LVFGGFSAFFCFVLFFGFFGGSAGWSGCLKATSGRVLFESVFKGQRRYFVGQVHHSMFGEWLRWINE
jgi:hypothetical protein